MTIQNSTVQLLRTRTQRSNSKSLSNCNNNNNLQQQTSPNKASSNNSLPPTMNPHTRKSPFAIHQRNHSLPQSVPAKPTTSTATICNSNPTVISSNCMNKMNPSEFDPAKTSINNPSNFVESGTQKCDSYNDQISLQQNILTTEEARLFSNYFKNLNQFWGQNKVLQKTSELLKMKKSNEAVHMLKNYLPMNELFSKNKKSFKYSVENIFDMLIIKHKMINENKIDQLENLFKGAVSKNKFSHKNKL